MWAEDDPQLPIVRALAERSGLVVAFTELEEIPSSPAPAPAAARAPAPASSGRKRKADDDASPTTPVQHKAAKSKKASPKITYDPRHCGRDQLKASIRAIFDALSRQEYESGTSAKDVREQLEADAKLAAGSLQPRKKEIKYLIDELITEDVFARFAQ